MNHSNAHRMWNAWPHRNKTTGRHTSRTKPSEQIEQLYAIIRIYIHITQLFQSFFWTPTNHLLQTKNELLMIGEVFESMLKFWIKFSETVLVMWKYSGQCTHTTDYVAISIWYVDSNSHFDVFKSINFQLTLERFAVRHFLEGNNNLYRLLYVHIKNHSLTCKF